MPNASGLAGWSQGTGLKSPVRSYDPAVKCLPWEQKRAFGMNPSHLHVSPITS
jgi:hypothetical protein